MSVVQLTTTTKGACLRGSVFVREVYRLVTLSTVARTATISVQHQVWLATYYKEANADGVFILSSDFSFCV